MRNKNLPSLFSDFAYNFNPSSLPISSTNIFKICLADWVAVSIAAQNSIVAEKILSQEKSVGVIDKNNKIVGTVHPSKIIHTVFGGRKENS